MATVETEGAGPRIQLSGVIYIAGDGHSGSSLLDILLGSHPDITSTGEVHRLSIEPASRACPCGESVAHCPYWTSIRHTLEKIEAKEIPAWDTFPVTAGTDAFRSRTARRLSQAAMALGSTGFVRHLSHINGAMAAQYAAAQRSWRLFHAITAHDGTQVVVDSTKSPGRMKALQHTQDGPGFAVVHLVRDGRAVVASDMRRRGRGSLRASARWVAANAKVLVMLSTFPRRRRVRIRYEDLCRDPEGTVNRISALLSLGPVDHLRLPESKEVHSIPGNPMLLSRISRIRLDNRWRRELKTRDLLVFELVAGLMNRLLGYGRRS